MALVFALFRIFLSQWNFIFVFYIVAVVCLKKKSSKFNVTRGKNVFLLNKWKFSSVQASRKWFKTMTGVKALPTSCSKDGRFYKHFYIISSYNYVYAESIQYNKIKPFVFIVLYSVFCSHLTPPPHFPSHLRGLLSRLHFIRWFFSRSFRRIEIKSGQNKMENYSQHTNTKVVRVFYMRNSAKISVLLH